MKKQHYLIIIIVIIVGAIIVKANLNTTSPANENPTATEESVPRGEPIFTWDYSEPVEKNFIPHSTISLTATYPGGETRTKEIETIEGGCNEYPEADKDVYKDSTMIICYYAGFGRYYKVVKSESKYLVQRKEFEEGSPEYVPPEQEFQTVSQF